jgi:hypothetical protein
MIGNAIGTFFQRKKGKGVGPLPPIPDLEGVIGLYIAKGLTNDSMKENPVWKDKSGQSNDLQMKNFSWNLGSGCGSYVIDQNLWKVNVPYVVLNKTASSVSVINEGGINGLVAYMRNTYWNVTKARKLKVTSSDFTTGEVNINYYVSAGGGEFVELKVNGITEIPANPNFTGTIYLSLPPNKSGSLTIEEIPDYQGAIVFDGVDDYGFCDTFPILTKEKGYTVMALRKWLTPEAKTSNEVIVSNLYNTDWSSINLGAFNCEVKYNNLNPKIINAISYSSSSRINIDENDLLFYQTSNNYNGNIIEVGNKNQGGSYLFVGSGSRNNLYANSAIYALCIIDHDTSDAERQLVIDYWKQEYPELFFDQAWTVTGKTNDDEDRATIANITGNGNDLILQNFGFAEGSGYGLYAQNYISYAITNRAVYTKTNSSIHVTKSITAGVNFTESARGVTIPSYRIKVTGIQSGQEMIYRGSNNTFLTNILSDGIYVLPAVENGSNLGFQFVSYTGDCNITIEQIPDYEGYLVTDGVNDRLRCKNFNLGKDFTVIGDWSLLNTSLTNAGLSLHPQIHVFNNVPDGVNVSFRGLNTRLSVKSLKAICSDGRCYDDDWNDLNIKVGDINSGNTANLFIGNNGTNFTKIAFKNLAIYNDKVLTKDQCIAGYNLLQTFKNS